MSSASQRNLDLERIVLEELKWSMSGFAKRVRERCAATGHARSVSTSTVSRWCAGARPGPELAAAACHVLTQACRRQVTPESLGWPSEDMRVAEQALQYGDLSHAVRMLRRLWQMDAVPRSASVRGMPFAATSSAVEALVMLPDTEIAGYGHRRVTVADIELLDAHTDLYGRTEARHGGGQFRSVFAAFLAAHAVPLLEGGFSAGRGRLLYGSVADAVLALASMAYDDQLPGLAQRYDLQAMRLSQAIGDRGRLARGCIH
ncbi:transcriptional regulator, partial [Kitasatospora sp. NPDC001574]